MQEVSREDQGLYRSEFEHDNCGIGAVVNIKGKITHDTVARCSRCSTILRALATVS